MSFMFSELAQFSAVYLKDLNPGIDDTRRPKIYM